MMLFVKKIISQFFYIYNTWAFTDDCWMFFYMNKLKNKQKLMLAKALSYTDINMTQTHL